MVRAACGATQLAAAVPGLGDHLVGAELAQVVGALADGVVRSWADGVDLGRQLGDGEPVGRGGEGGDGAQGGADACLVQVDATHAGRADDRGLRELVQDAVGYEGDVRAVEGGAETLERPGEAGDDLGELVEDAADPRGLWCCALSPQSAARARLWCSPSASRPRSGP